MIKIKTYQLIFITAIILIMILPILTKILQYLLIGVILLIAIIIVYGLYKNKHNNLKEEGGHRG